MNLQIQQSRPSVRASAAASMGAPPAARAVSIAVDRQKLQSLIELLDRYDLNSDTADTGDLCTQLRAFGTF